MNIIAFDLEFSSNRYRSLCGFGYVITKEKFIIESKEKIPIYPDDVDEYHLDNYRDNIEYGKTGKTYEEEYQRIKSILTKENTMYLAHGCDNDILTIRDMNDRHHLSNYSINNLYDTSKMMKQFDPEDEHTKLEHICEKFNIRYTPHDPESDAYACLMVFKHIFEQENLPLEKFLEKYKPCIKQ